MDSSIMRILKGTLHKRDVDFLIEEEFLEGINENLDISNRFKNLESFSSLDNSYDFLIGIGGDGTILKSVTFVGDLGIPIIGINTGRLGFLTAFFREKHHFIYLKDRC